MGMPCEGNVTEVKCKWLVEHLGHGTHRIQFPNQIASLSYTTRSCKVYCNPQKKKKRKSNEGQTIVPVRWLRCFHPSSFFRISCWAGNRIQYPQLRRVEPLDRDSMRRLDKFNSWLKATLDIGVDRPASEDRFEMAGKSGWQRSAWLQLERHAKRRGLHSLFTTRRRFLIPHAFMLTGKVEREEYARPSDVWNGTTKNKCKEGKLFRQHICAISRQAPDQLTSQVSRFAARTCTWKKSNKCLLGRSWWIGNGNEEQFNNKVSDV